MNNNGQNYRDFINFTAVVNTRTDEEFLQLVELCEKRGLSGIRYLARFGYDELHRDCGEQVIPYGELCVEYRMGDATFTIGDRESYEKYGCRILTVDEL